MGEGRISMGMLVEGQLTTKIPLENSRAQDFALLELESAFS